MLSILSIVFISIHFEPGCFAIKKKYCTFVADTRIDMKVNYRIIIVFFLELIAITNLINARTTHNEPNGFTWYEESELIDRSNPRRGDYNWADDINGHDLFGRTYGITFHCVDADDEGQFAVTQLFGAGDYREGLYTRDGKCILSPESGPVVFDKRFRSGSNYYFIARDEDSNNHWQYGIIDDKGKIVVPFIYKKIENTVYNGERNLENCLYVEIGTGSEGIVRLDGSYVIKPEMNKHVYSKGPFIEASLPTPNSRTLMNYEGDILVNNALEIYNQPSDSRFKIIMPDDCIGFLGYDGKWILSPDLGYSDFVEFTDNSGKSYFKIKKNGLYGVLGSSRNEILPCEFEDIEYIGGNFFKFKSGDFWGVVTDLGKVIIPTSRGYDSIGKYSMIQKTIPFTKAGSRGECNSRGTVLSIHKVQSATQNKETTNHSANSPLSVGNKNGNNSLNSPFIDGKKYAIFIMVTDEEIPLKGNNYLIKNGNKIIMTFQDYCQREYIIKSPFKKEAFPGLTSCEVSGGPWKGNGKFAVQLLDKTYFVFFGGGMNDPTEFYISTKPVD